MQNSYNTNIIIRPNSYKKTIAIFILLLPYVLSSTQTITTTTETITSCPGTVTIPINVTNFNNVASISLTLEYSGVMMDYIGFKNPHPQLSSGPLLINGINDKVIISWFSLTPINIGSATLLELEFDYFKDDASLSWDTATSGNCQYSDSLSNIPALFIDGGVISLLTHPDLLFPQDQSTEVPLNSIFKWSKSNCYPSYRIQVSKDSVFSDIIIAATGLSDTAYAINNLDSNTVYFWRVNASISQQTSPWSQAVKFSTIGPVGIFEHNNQNTILNLSISPNPIQDQGSIMFDLPGPAKISLLFHDISGRQVYEYFPNNKYDKGSQMLTVNLSELPTGFFTCELKAYCNNQIYIQRKKIIVVSD